MSASLCTSAAARPGSSRKRSPPAISRPPLPVLMTGGHGRDPPAHAQSLVEIVRAADRGAPVDRGGQRAGAFRLRLGAGGVQGPAADAGYQLGYRGESATRDERTLG